MTVTDPDDDAYDKKLALKNNAPFHSWVTRINGELIEDAQDLDIVMPLYNLINYSKNYQKTTRSLFNYYRDEPNSGSEGNIDNSIKNLKIYLTIKQI